MGILKVNGSFTPSEAGIQRILVSQRQFMDRCPIMLPNCYTQPDNEADVFMIRKSDLCDEFEVKISRSDFLKDREKIIQYREISKEGDLFRGSEWENWCAGGRIQGEEPWKMNKFDAYREGYGVPNYFWYVTLDGIIKDESEVPDFAGVVIVSKHGLARVRKNPKMLHKRKIDEDLKIKVLTKGMHRYLNHFRGWR